jgi:serine/threonine protein kinase
VKRILNPNPRKRFTIEQIMLHPWMQVDGMLSDSDYVDDDEDNIEQREDDWS